MTKRILYFVSAILVLFALSFSLNYYLSSTNLSYSLLEVYIFHAIAAVVLYVSVELVALNLANFAGFVYLGLLLFKFGLFFLIFKEPVFDNADLSQPERISLVVPLFVFLIAEVTGVGKLLNSK